MDSLIQAPVVIPDVLCHHRPARIQEQCVVEDIHLHEFNRNVDAETQHTEMQNAYKSLFEDKAKYNAIMRAVGMIVYRDMRRGSARP